MTKASPTARKRQLGAALRRLRRERGLNGDDVAARLEWSPAKISNIETARVTSHPNDIKLLLDLYETGEAAERELLLRLCRESRTKGWWQHFGKGLEPWANRYIGLEDAAVGIRYFGIDLVYGPMQTEDYARAVISAGCPDSDHADVEHGVNLRATRRQLLMNPDAPKLWAVIDESALHRGIGGRYVMREQLDHLGTLADLPHVVVQVLPYDAGEHPAMGSQFQILDFEVGDDIVYLEDLTGAQYLEKRAEIDRYSLAFDHLRAQALSPSDSVEKLREIAKEHPCPSGS